MKRNSNLNEENINIIIMDCDLPILSGLFTIYYFDYYI